MGQLRLWCVITCEYAGGVFQGQRVRGETTRPVFCSCYLDSLLTTFLVYLV